MRGAISITAAAAFALALACSDDNQTPGPEAGTEAGAEGGTDGGEACPAYLPPAGDPCATQHVCAYGDPSCLATATCGGDGEWQTSLARCPGSASSCPATREEATGEACSGENDSCDYAGLGCRCTNCDDGPAPQCEGPLTWHCDRPNVDPDCPHARPTVGESCGAEGHFCDYGCQPNASRECQGGKWVEASKPGGCPVSTRRAKREIRYLTASRRARIARQALGLRLATYKYRGRPAGRTHLGFILEDAPSSFASDMRSKQVDLYAFTSMVLALAKQQQQQIADLRRQLAALRARVQ